MKKDPSNQVKKRLITIRELAKITGYSIGTLYNLKSRNALPFPYVRVSSRKIMIDILDVEKWIQGNKVEPEKEQEIGDDFLH